jgi:hypothetical protein
MPEPGHKKTVLRVLESLRGFDDLKQLLKRISSGNSPFRC